MKQAFCYDYPMENTPNFEHRELVIENLLINLAQRENMHPDDIFGDLIVFAPVEGSDSVNDEYIAELAAMIGITPEEMASYAIQKAKIQSATK